MVVSKIVFFLFFIYFNGLVVVRKINYPLFMEQRCIRNIYPINFKIDISYLSNANKILKNHLTV